MTVPSSSGVLTGPTGQVFASLPGNFLVGGSTPAFFLFATLSGTIDGWAGGTTAEIEAFGSPGAVFTGLALANNGIGNFLYAADFLGGGIQVFDSSFSPTNFGAGSFTDPTLPAGYAPYNIQTIGSDLYVEYAEETGGHPAVGAGRRAWNC